jgi:hypothetical protein
MQGSDRTFEKIPSSVAELQSYRSQCPAPETTAPLREPASQVAISKGKLRTEI